MNIDPLFIKDFKEKGFALLPFSKEICSEMTAHIEGYIRELAFSHQNSKTTSSLKDLAMSIPDDIWAQKMTRAFRIFPKSIADKIYQWADENVRKKMGKSRSAVNVVYPAETVTNPSLNSNDIAIYWRTVRPGKPDAGRPHRDASFWVLEFEEGFDPKIPFAFNYLQDCIKLWIPLKGCTPQTTLQVIPTSHQEEIPTIVEQTEYGRRPTISKSWLDENEVNFISPIELSEGSTIAFDMNLVHRGPTHTNTELRISAELCFIVK